MWLTLVKGYFYSASAHKMGDIMGTLLTGTADYGLRSEGLILNALVAPKAVAPHRNCDGLKIFFSLLSL
jgi:hypothetical protein